MSCDTGVSASAPKAWFYFNVLLRRCFPQGFRCEQSLVQRWWWRRHPFPNGCLFLLQGCCGAPGVRG